MSTTSTNHSALQGVALILPITLTVMGSALLAPVVPQLMQEFKDLDNVKFLVPLLLPLPALCIAIFAPVAGWLGDKTSHRKLLIASMLIYGLLGVAPAFLHSYWIIFATRVGVGLCEAGIATCSTTLIAEYFSGQQRDKWLGNQAAVASLSSLALYPLAGLMGSILGWQGPFFVYSIGIILALAVVFFTDELNSIRGDDQAKTVDTTQAMKLPIAHLIKVCSITLVGGILFYMVIFQLSTALLNFNITNSTTSGLLLSLATLGISIGAFAYQKIHKFISTERLVSLEFVIFGIGFIGMSIAPNLHVFMIVTFLGQIGLGLFLPTMLTWAVNPLTTATRGKGTGIWQSTFSFGQFASTLCFGLVLSVLGDENYMFSFAVFGAVALLLSLTTLLFLSPNK